jgi:hypothetical protein
MATQHDFGVRAVGGRRLGFAGLTLAACGLLAVAGALAAPDDPRPAPSGLPEMDQAARDWLDSPGSAAFGRWMVKALEQYPEHPEWVAMFADILQGSQLGARDGWFPKAAAQTRHDWKTVAARYDRDGDGTIGRGEFPGSSNDFTRLDRDGDGGITANDLAWPDHALTSTPGAMLYMMADADSDGRVTRAEFDALFQKADIDNRGFLSQDELRGLFGPPPSPPRPAGSGAAPKSSRPSKSTLIRGLFAQEIGSMKPGPSVGEAAPDFTLRTADGAESVTLSERIGKKPVVLVFGNITCGPFRTQAGNVEKLFQRYKDRAEFLMIYVREAHPSDGWHMSFNDAFEVTLAQPKTYEERVGVAQTCRRKLDFDMPFLVDTIDDRVGGPYSGMPSRLYVIDRAGKVAYKSGRGPFGFKPAEMEQALLWTLAEDAAASGTQAQADDPSRPADDATAKLGASDAK